MLVQLVCLNSFVKQTFQSWLASHQTLHTRESPDKHDRETYSASRLREIEDIVTVYIQH